MSNQELNNYIYAQSQRGVSADEIRNILEQNGWSKPDIDTAFSIVQPKGATPAAVATPAPATATTPATPVTSTVKLQPLQPLQPRVQPAALPATPAQQPIPAAGPVVDMFDMNNAQPQLAELQLQHQPASPLLMQQDPSATPGTSVFGPTGMPQHMEAMPAEAAQPQQGTGTHMKNGMSRKTMMLVFACIGVVLVAAIAGGAYAYYRFYQSAERVGGLMVQNLAQLKSFQYNLALQPRTIQNDAFTQIVGTGDVEDAAVSVAGVVDIANDHTPSVSGVVTATVQTAATTQAAAGELTIGAELRYAAGILYAQLQRTQGLELPALTLLTDRWFAISDANVTSQVGSNPISELNTLTTAEKTQLREAFRTANVLVFGKKIGSETIHDTATNEYSFFISKDGMKAFVTASAPVLAAHQFCTTADCSDVLAQVNTMEDVAGQLWIGKTDYQLYQIRFVATSSAPNALAKDVLVSLTLWDHNSNVAVEAPNPVSSLTDAVASVLQPLFGTNRNTNANVEVDVNLNENANTNSTVNTNAAANTNAANVNAAANTNAATNGNANTNTPNTTRDTDNDGLLDIDETVYGTDASDSDTDNDGYLDGEEVDHGYNPAGPGTLEQ